MSLSLSSPSPSEGFVACLAGLLQDGAVVATGVASPLPLLAIALAKKTHAPRLRYVSCVGALDPSLETLHASPEDLRYLEGRTAEVSIAELFDHARRGRVDTVFFGAAEVDGTGATNMTAVGPLDDLKTKLPGVAGAATLRQWVRQPVLIVPKQSRRNLVKRVQFATTRDDGRETCLVTDLATFMLSPKGARLTSLHSWATLDEVRERTGFEFAVPDPIPTTRLPDAATVEMLRRLDPNDFRSALVGA